MYEVVGAIHHRGGSIQKGDLVDALDLARFQHGLLPVGDFEARPLQFKQHGRLDDIDPDRHIGDARLPDQGGNLVGMPLHQSEGRRDGAAQAEQARLTVFRLEPRSVEPVVHGGRAEVPQDRIGAAASEQRPAADLVALPFADLGGGEIADVVDVHHQQCAEIGLLERLARSA